MDSALEATGLAWRRSEERTTTRFTVSHAGLSDWLTKHFGCYAHAKTLPGWIFGMPEADRDALLRGYLDADGHEVGSGWAVSTVSAMLAIAVRILAASLGYDTSITKSMPKRRATIENRPVSERPLWRLSLCARRYGHAGDRHWWGRRRGALSPRGIETVYDLTVEEDHSFVAWGFVVHNCQAYSVLRRANPGAAYPDLVGPTRDLLVASGLPYVIENVPGSPLRTTIVLCGSMFDLEARCEDGTVRQLRRHRLFESNVLLLQPECRHRGEALGVYGGGRAPRWTFANGATKDPYGRRGGYQGTMAEKTAVMGIDWMPGSRLSQALPPAYCKYIGTQLLAHLGASV